LIYSIGKRHCEDLVRAFRDTCGLEFTILRFFNLYGPGADASRAHPGIIPYLIGLCRRGEAPTLHGDGEQRRDYVFLADLVRLLVASIERGPLNATVNAASGESVSVREIFAAVQAAVGSNLTPTFRDPSKLWDKAAALFAGVLPFSKERVARDVLKSTRGDTRAAERLLSWRTTTRFADGVRAIVEATPA
jgi:UDP-glucose 4-epimerase